MKLIDLPLGIKDKTFIIQGLGKLGKPLAHLLVSNGAICVGVKDHDAHIYNLNGINLRELCDYKDNTGSIINYGPTKPESNDKIFTEQCDILILAAIQKSLICYTADKVKAKIIIEAAEGPVMPTAHKILTGRFKLVIPDIYACSGATIASYLEYLKGLHQIYSVCDNTVKMLNSVYENALSELIGTKENLATVGGESINSSSVDERKEGNVVTDTLECVVADVGREILEVAAEYNLGIDVRTAAYIVGIRNMFNNILSSGRLL